eukprot:scaffold140005_cov34-Prasinocladus_malaysianus.AAC.1
MYRSIASLHQKFTIEIINSSATCKQTDDKTICQPALAHRGKVSPPIHRFSGCPAANDSSGDWFPS